ncbi:S9 family peptidase [Novosphingobium soli]|uniref:Alpha/beta hydrolase family protein n=1 Tax=Novosphingobium soli TaxID=574956 RepID=A0ABV6CRM4_9SPHN
MSLAGSTVAPVLTSESGGFMTFLKWLCGTALAALAVQSVSADEISEAAAKFGARPSVLDLGISPNGEKIFIIGTRIDGGENAIVVDLATTHAVPILSSAGGTEKLTHCQFIMDDRVVCGIYVFERTGGSVDAATRLATISADGKDMKKLSAPTRMSAYYRSGYGGGIIDYNVADDPRSVLMVRHVAPEVTSSSLVASKERGLTVEAVDVYSLKRRVVEPPRDVAAFQTDGLGNVRIMETMPVNTSGYVEPRSNYFVRPVPGGDWQRLSTVTYDSGKSRGFEPIAVAPERNSIIGFDDYQGRKALFEKPLTSGGEAKVLLAHPRADVDGLVRMGRDQRIVGVTYATEKRYVEYFDKELAALAASLRKALVGNPQISIIDASKDEKRLILFIGSDVDPGQYYMFDKATKKLSPIMGVRENLGGVKFGEMKPVTFPAADGTQIPGYLTLPPNSTGKNLPAIVMPHGGPAARDEWGFDWLVQYFVTQGYAVLQPNYRGSTGYGSGWFQKNGFQSWKTAIGDVNDAGRWLVSQGITSSDKLAIVGWSYGGYAALQSAVLDPDLYKAVVAIAPVTDLEVLKGESRYYSNHRIMENFIGSGPHIAEGSPARHADRFKAPVLLFHGDLDMNVGVEESRLMNSRLKAAGKSVDYVEFKSLEHQLDDNAARTQLLASTDRFLRRTLGVK